MKYGRYLYYANLTTYAIFLTFLTSFALLTPNAKAVEIEERNGNKNVVGKAFCLQADNKTRTNGSVCSLILNFIDNYKG
jgi:hypothetical protein